MYLGNPSGICGCQEAQSQQGCNQQALTTLLTGEGWGILARGMMQMDRNVRLGIARIKLAVR